MLRERLKEKIRLRVLEASQRLQSLAMGRMMKGEPTPYTMQIVNDLQTEGVHVTTLNRLLPQTARNILDSAAALLMDEPARDESNLWNCSSSSTDLSADALLARLPAIYLLGLDAGILGLAQTYLRLPVAYHGAVLRHSKVDRQRRGPRLWHQDQEDCHVIRMVLYLNDVTPGGGPFEYIPRSLGITQSDFSSADGMLTDEQVREVVPMSRWKRCFGPTGTVVLCDTAKVFHHESLQTERDRSVVMIGYSSRRPTGIGIAKAHFPVERVKSVLMQIVPAANYDHVFGWRRL